MPRKILVKVGSRVLFDEKHQLDVKTIENLAQQIATLTQNGYQIIFVSSGAFMTGIFSLEQQKNFSNDGPSKGEMAKAISAHGQVKLMAIYKDIFEYYRMPIGQILLNHHDFDTPASKDIKVVFETLLEAGILPITNENDPTAHANTKFTDNDELARFLSKLLHVDLVVLLTDVDGLFTAHPLEAGSTLVKEFTNYSENGHDFITDNNFAFGRGGMQSKVANSISIAKSGIPVFIANGKKSHVLTNIVQNKQHQGTFFPAVFV